MILYHFTCAHAAKRITASGELRPHPQIQLDGRRLLWLTDLDAPEGEALGLTQVNLRCDRSEYRVTVDCDAARWVDYLRAMPTSLRRLARTGLHGIGLPMHWYVSEESTPVLAIDHVGG